MITAKTIGKVRGRARLAWGRGWRSVDHLPSRRQI